MVVGIYFFGRVLFIFVVALQCSAVSAPWMGRLNAVNESNKVFYVFPTCVSIIH